MFSLKKIHPPFGSADSPIIEASYSEGEIRVVDGLCKVRLPETRDRLLKMGYSDTTSSAVSRTIPAEGVDEQVKPAGGGTKTATARKSQEAQHSRPLGRKRR